MNERVNKYTLIETLSVALYQVMWRECDCKYVAGRFYSAELHTRRCWASPIDDIFLQHFIECRRFNLTLSSLN